jgi:DNA-directed RNA polymerase subunit M/transcription elongation factor TFIIS
MSSTLLQAIYRAAQAVNVDVEWVTSQVLEDLTSWELSEEEYINTVLIPLKIGWNHVSFERLLKTQQEQDDYILDPFEVEEGVVQCFKCKSYKVFSVSVQTRAADEPTTTMSQCTQCNNKWSQNG